MADLKISQLNTITTLTPATDVLPVVDVNGVTKKITTNQILGSSGTATLASATITGDLTVDTNVLKVDTLNNRVGVGTASPLFPLDIISSGATTVAVRSTGAVGLFRGYAITDGTTEYGQFKQSLSSGELQIVSGNAGWGGFLTISTGGSERYRIASDGVATWSNVGGVAGTAMTLNANGLGIGVTPSAWGSGLKAFELGAKGNAAFSTANAIDGFFVVNNAYYDTAYKYGMTGYASRYTQYQGQHQFFTAPSGTVNTAITFTERLRLKETGQLRFVPLASDPSGAEAGDVYYNSSSNKLKCYNGTTWNDLF